MNRTKSSSRIIALITAVTILFVMFFSFIYGAEHVNHHCTDSHCPVCATMNQSVNSFRQLGLGGMITATIVAIVFLQIRVKREYTCFSSHITLFSQKVRLNN